MYFIASLLLLSFSLMIGCESSSSSPLFEDDSSATRDDDRSLDDIQRGGSEEIANAQGELGVIHFEVAWSDAIPDDLIWMNDLGYEVRLRRATLRHLMLQLTPCPLAQQVGRRPKTSWLTRLSQILIGAAWAGHGGGEIDPSQIEVFAPEDLLAGQRVYMGRSTPSEALYCFAYWSVSGLSIDGLTPPEPTLSLEGEWRSPSAETWVHFELDSTLNWGVQVSLPSIEEEGEGLIFSNVSGRLTWLRRSSTLFDTIDFTAHEGDAIARRVLQNLLNSAEVDLKTREVF
jgi:hypothetical protein